MKRFLAITSALCIGLTSGPALAADTSLYAEAAPADASFVRFVGFDGAQTAAFAGKTFDLKSDEVDAYIPVSAAHLNGVEPGHFFTIVNQSTGSSIITEAARDGTSKVTLFLVNATDRVLDLRVADGSMAVIDDVSGLSAGARAVNPVQITLGVFEDGSDDAIAVFDVAMKRGQNLSFFADADGVRLIENRFGAVAH